MKKLVCLVLVLVMTFGVALADTIDLSGMSIDELVSLRAQVYEAIYAKLGNAEYSIFPEGTYVAGKTIKPGTYDIVVLEFVNNKGHVELYGADNEYIDSIYSNVGMPIRITLGDGEKVIMDRCSGLITAVEKPSWMP